MRRDGLLLAEILEAGERILVLVAGRSPADFEQDPDRRDALLWNFTVLGEAVGQLSGELKDDRPEISWSSPVRMRNRIVHGYWSIDLDILVTTALEDLGRFLEAVRTLLSAQPDTSEESDRRLGFVGSRVDRTRPGVRRRRRRSPDHRGRACRQSGVGAGTR